MTAGEGARRAARAYAAYARELHGSASLDEARAAYERVGAGYPVPHGVDSRAASADGVPVEWISASAAGPSPVVVFFHGGGYSSGSIGTHRALMARLALAIGGRVLGVDYRRSPEHRFPAALDDAVTAYRWALAQGAEAHRLVVAGDSAGGGLALATLLALPERGLPLPAGYAGIGPWVDLTVASDSLAENAATDPVVTAAGLTRAAAGYLGPADPRNPFASPLYGELDGLPPLLLQVGSLEALLDDSRRLAERAKAAGVPVTLEVWDGMVHGWHQFADFLPEGREAIERIARFVHECVAERATR